jgi:hypothetical protein
MEVFGSVLIPGRIAAAYVAAVHAKAKMYPGIAAFQALFAAARMRLHVVNLIQVRALSHCLIITTALPLALERPPGHGGVELHGREAHKKGHQRIEPPGND